ncbi:MAG: endonuclease/exonuclease/phosphatase family protein, partial [Actinobacteria bacterium]|nr:endonuclease/exonuclease/phosphatase family protein [Actinomycetota bacterium]
TWGIALVSRLPVRSWRTIEVGRASGRVDVAHRVAIVAEVDVAGTAVTVAATHLSFVPANAAVQLRRLRTRLPAGRPTVVAGDCNLWGPVAASVAGLRRAVRGRTYPAHRPHSQLDHVLLSGHVEAVAGEVLADVGSDHLPVRVRLRVGDGAAEAG